MNVKLVIFDMDGTLANTEPIHETVRRQITDDCTGGAPFTADLHPVGRSMAEMYGELLDICHLDWDIGTLVERHTKQTLQGVIDAGLLPEDGVTEVLDLCRKRGIRCAVASSSPRYLVEGVLHHLKLEACFSDVVCGDDCRHLKPAPDIYLAVLAHMGVSAKDAIAIEDSATGIQSANAAGLRCVGYRNPGSGAQDLSGAWRIVDHLKTLTKWLQDG